MYLTDNQYYNAYTSDTSNLYQLVFSGYEDSAASLGTKVEYAIETITSPQAFISFATEKLGLHSNTYNEALDTANKIFVEKLLNNSTLIEVGDQYGEIKTFVNRTQKMVSLFNSLKLKSSDSQIERTAEYYLQESFDYLWDQGIITCLSEKQIGQLWAEINAEDFQINKYLKLASTEIEVAQAFVSALIMADMKVELVDSLIAAQKTDTVLKQGMVRLKNQLSGGFVTYFIDNYITNKVIDSCYSVIIKCVSDSAPYSTYKLASSILKVAKVIAFDWIWDVPSYNNVLAFQVLSCYSRDISNVLSQKAKDFAEGPFVSDKIIEYEDLFSAYIASNKAAVQLLESIAEAESKGYVKEYLNIYALFTSAQEHGVEIVTIHDGITVMEMRSSSTQSEVDDMLRRKCSAGIKSITINNGIESKTISSMAIQYYRAMLNGLDGSGKGLISYYKSIYEDVDVYKEYVGNIKSEILETPADLKKRIDKSVYGEWTYSVNENTKLKLQSDLVEVNSIYSVNDKIQGSIIIKKNGLNILENQAITIDGNLNIVGTKVTVDGQLTVEGVLYISGSADITNNGKTKVYKAFLEDMNYYSGCNSITNNGYFEIENNFEHSTNTYGNTRTGYRIIQETDDAVLAIGGDFIANAWDVCTTITNGTVIFNGDTQQIVKNLRAHTLMIDNIGGIKYLTNTYVNGLYDTKGNTIDANGYVTIVDSSTIFVNGYDYNNIQLQSNIDLTKSIKATVTTNGYSITIPREAEACIDGDLNIIGAKVTVNGKLMVTGKVDISNNADLTNNGTVQIGSVYLQTMNYHSGRNSITNNGYFEIINDFESSAERFGNSRTGYRIIQDTDDAVLAIGGNLLANTWDVCTTITKGTVMFNGDQQQIVKNFSAPIVIIENRSLSGVVFATAITASRLFNHQGNNFTLYNNGSGSSFVDYDGDGLNDNIDPYPICAKHEFGEWYEIKTSTCTAAGTDERECTVCHHKETKTTDAKGHIYAEAVIEKKVESNCTTDGSYDSVTYCLRCSAELSREHKTIDKLGHNHSTEWTIDVEPICLTVGSKSHHCTRCDNRSDATEVEVLGHSFTDYKSNNDATYTENGTETAKCDRCTVTDTRLDEDSALGLDQKFKDEMTALSRDADAETTYAALYSALQTYATLSDPEKMNVANEYATLRQLIENYNAKAQVANAELAETTEIAYASIAANGFTFLAALWFLLKKKFFIQGGNVS